MNDAFDTASSGPARGLPSPTSRASWDGPRSSHIPGFLGRPDVEPWIINRRDPGQLAHLQATFGFAQATADWHDVIDARPDIVSLAGPVALRAEQARAALEAGIHVLAEKPFTLDPADGASSSRVDPT